jgi:hypothetical protein
MNTAKFIINTNDKDFFSELIALQSKHFKLKFPVLNRALTPEEINTLANDFIISISSAIAYDLFKQLIKKFSSKKTSTKITINNINITNKNTDIFLIIEKTIHDQENNPNQNSDADKIK